MDYIFHFGPILARWDLLARGALMTLELAAASMAVGLVIAVLGAVLRSFGPAWLRGLIAVYVELIRNTPMLVQLYVVFFVLPPLGLRMSSTQAAIVALSANLGAYAIEIIRAGIDATPKGVVEAAMSLGLPRLKIIRHIVLVPALRAIYPALGSQFVLQLLGSSLVSAIAVEELTAVGNNLMMQTFRNFEVFLLVGAVYFVLVQVFQALFDATYRRLFRWPV